MKLFRLIVILLLVSTAFSQTYLDSTGSPTFTSAFPVEHGFINLANGNLHLEIPLASYPGRGDLNYSARLVYDSRIWTPNNFGTYNAWRPNNPGSGWRFVDSGKVGSVSYQTGYWEVCWNSEFLIYEENRYYTHSWTWTDPTGTPRLFNVSSEEATYCDSNPATTVVTGFAADGSGYLMKITGWNSAEIFAPNGMQVYPSVVDRNGNFYSSDSNGNTIDPLGKGIGSGGIDVPAVAVSTNSGNTIYTYRAPNSATAAITVSYKSARTANTSFDQSGINEDTTSTFTNLIHRITFPDGTYYEFDYDANYQDLISVRLPSGGLIEYGYTIFPDANGNSNRWVNSRTKGSGIWTFTQEACYNCQTTTVADPNGKETSYSFALTSDAPWVTSVVACDGSCTTNPTLLKSVLTSYTSSGPTSVSEQVTTVYNTSTSIKKKVAYTYDNDSYRNLTSVKEWDWVSGGSSFPSTPYRETVNTYKTDAGFISRNLVRLPSVTLLKEGTTEVARTTFYYDATTLQTSSASNLSNPGTTYRGNLTAVTRCKSYTSGSCASNVTTYGNQAIYFDSGMAKTVYDFGGHGTTYTLGYNGTLVTRVDLPTTGSITHRTLAGFDLYTGLLVATCGENNTDSTCSTSSSGADVYRVGYNNMFKPEWEIRPDGGTTEYEYHATDRYTERWDDMNSSTNTYVYTEWDTFGRTVRTGQYNGSGYNHVDVCYDSLGRVHYQSYPYLGTFRSSTFLCSASTGLAFTYDALSRPIRTYKSATEWSYNEYALNFHSVYDENEHAKNYQYDAFGRIKVVTEYAGNNVSGYGTGKVTSYTYNAFDQLTSVSQGSGSSARGARTFTFDALGRLIDATAPESGRTCYGTVSSTTCTPGYDDDGNLLHKTDARGIQVGYTYDALHRLTSKTLPSTPSNTVYGWSYDVSPTTGFTTENAKGRLVQQSNNVDAATNYKYDTMGRVKYQANCIPSYCAADALQVKAEYDFLGNIVKLTYPTARELTFEYDRAARQKKVNFSKYETTNVNLEYWSVPASVGGNAGFHATGRIHYQNFNAGGIQIWTGQDSRMRLSGVQVYDFANPQNNHVNQTYSYHYNSNISRIGDSITSGKSLDFAYDGMNRLTRADTDATSGSNYFEHDYTYDDFGNLTNHSPGFNNSVDTNNRFTGYCYDSAGNLLKAASCGTADYAYDADNKMISASGWTYSYYADGLRARKTNGYSWTDYIYFGGVVLSERKDGVWTDYIYGGGQLIAISPGSYSGTPSMAGTKFVVTDHLGSARMMFDNSNAKIWEGDYKPYGLDHNAQTGSPSYRFTGYERDTESGLDHSWFRQYKAAQGRFMTADPYLGSLRVSNPQSINRYSYTLGDPVNRIDPLGLDNIGIAVGGNTIFDAIAGAQGTYYRVANGKVEWGWDMWSPWIYQFTDSDGESYTFGSWDEYASWRIGLNADLKRLSIETTTLKSCVDGSYYVRADAFASLAGVGSKSVSIDSVTVVARGETYYASPNYGLGGPNNPTRSRQAGVHRGSTHDSTDSRTYYIPVVQTDAMWQQSGLAPRGFLSWSFKVSNAVATKSITGTQDVKMECRRR